MLCLCRGAWVICVDSQWLSRLGLAASGCKSKHFMPLACRNRLYGHYQVAPAASVCSCSAQEAARQLPDEDWPEKVSACYWFEALNHHAEPQSLSYRGCPYSNRAGTWQPVRLFLLSNACKGSASQTSRWKHVWPIFSLHRMGTRCRHFSFIDSNRGRYSAIFTAKITPDGNPTRSASCSGSGQGPQGLAPPRPHLAILFCSWMADSVCIPVICRRRGTAAPITHAACTESGRAIDPARARARSRVRGAWGGGG